MSKERVWAERLIQEERDRAAKYQRPVALSTDNVLEAMACLGAVAQIVSASIFENFEHEDTRENLLYSVRPLAAYVVTWLESLYPGESDDGLIENICPGESE